MHLGRAAKGLASVRENPTPRPGQTCCFDGEKKVVPSCWPGHWSWSRSTWYQETGIKSQTRQKQHDLVFVRAGLAAAIFGPLGGEISIEKQGGRSTKGLSPPAYLQSPCLFLHATSPGSVRRLSRRIVEKAAGVALQEDGEILLVDAGGRWGFKFRSVMELVGPLAFLLTEPPSLAGEAASCSSDGPFLVPVCSFASLARIYHPFTSAHSDAGACKCYEKFWQKKKKKKEKKKKKRRSKDLRDTVRTEPRPA